MDETVYLKISCPSCTDNVEFPVEMRGEVVPCPHCNENLTLEPPATPSAVPAEPVNAATSEAPPENLYQRLRALNNLNAAPAEINVPDGFKPGT